MDDVTHSSVRGQMHPYDIPCLDKHQTPTRFTQSWTHVGHAKRPVLQYYNLGAIASSGHGMEPSQTSQEQAQTL